MKDREFRIRKPPLFEVPYMIMYGVCNIVDGIVTLSTLGWVQSSYALWSAKLLSLARNRHRP